MMMTLEVEALSSIYFENLCTLQIIARLCSGQLWVYKLIREE
jgi:hypothetical protein